MSPYTWIPRAKQIDHIIRKKYKTTDSRLLFRTSEKFELSGYKLIHLVCRYEKWLFHEANQYRITKGDVHSFPAVHQFLLQEEPINTHIVKSHFLVTNFSTSIQIRDLDDNEDCNPATINSVSS
jgi:hypothetical protein